MTVELSPAILYAIIGHIAALAFYFGVTWVTLRTQGRTLAKVTDLLENHGERLVKIETRHKLIRKPISTTLRKAK